MAEPSVAEPSVAEPSVAEPFVAEPFVAEPSGGEMDVDQDWEDVEVDGEGFSVEDTEKAKEKSK
ncbi:hypothetical protein, partial [Klebsiella pneumoniae]|uniref:hypothetical protein n=1 Tax=Klebsiella pneumoniae TaxID=573 RepID=UPI001C53323C